MSEMPALFYVQVPGTDEAESVEADHYVAGERGQLDFYGSKRRYTDYNNTNPLATYAAGYWQKVW